MGKDISARDMEERKEELLRGLVDVRKRILEVSSLLPKDKHNEPFIGKWDIKDLLAHLAGWDATNLEAAKEILSGELPSFYDHYDRDWETYNDQLVAKYKKDDLDELITSLDSSHQKLISFLKSLSAPDLYQDKGLRKGRFKVTIGRLLEVEKKDEEEHLMQVKEFAQ